VQWVECCATAGRGQWFLTGNIHEGASGSVLVARTWVRKHLREISERLCVSPRVDLCRMRPAGTGDGSPSIDMHVHLPETELAKDVSIYGAASATSMISIMTGLPVRPDVAVLGEITLAGVLWPLEQVNEAEVLTAKSANIRHLIVPEDNLRQMQRVSPELKRGLKITGAVRLMDVLDVLFEVNGAKTAPMDVAGPGSSSSSGEEDEVLGNGKLPAAK
jgi:ATP-dependent Lon protease